MNKLTVLLFSVIFISTSCKKQHSNVCMPDTPQSEAASIAAYCNANSIVYTVDSNGIYYKIIDPGSGEKPDINSTITVTYSSFLLNGQAVDTTHISSPFTNPLNQFIEGWQIAIPYIQQGGHIKMVIPSSLAYGCTGIQNIIPSNAPLYFDVLLSKVSN